MLVVAAVAGAAYFWVGREPAQQAVKSSAPMRCPTPSPTPRLPLPAEVTVELLNGTSRNGLAKSVGDALAARGFAVPVKANAPAALPGPTRVLHRPGLEAQAALVAAHIIGAAAQSDPAAPAGRVQVTLGSSYTRLATLAEAAAAQAATVPSPTASAPAGCPA